MLQRILVTLALLIAIVPARTAVAEAIALDLDPGQTSVDFTLGAFLHTVHGSFKLKSGALRIDSATGSAQGEIDIDLTTGVTGIGARDGVMRGSVLETARYPDAVFTADSVTGRLNADGASALDIHGRLAIHGAAHDVTLHVTTMSSGTQVNAATRFTIPYAQWGMKNPSTLFLRVDDHVDVNVRALAHIRTTL